MQPSESLLKKHQRQFLDFLRHIGANSPEAVRGERIVEIGFKNGLFLQQCHAAGMQAIGTEVNSDYLTAVRNDRQLDGIEFILAGDDGTLDIADGSTDYVVSFQVLEHVADLEGLIAQCVRILKPGGMMIHACPNYQSFYEGHYGVIWWPFLTKRSGAWYLRMLRCYSPYYQSLSLVKPSTLRHLEKQWAGQLTTISRGKAEFMASFCPEQIARIGQPLLRRVFTALWHLRAISKPMLWIIAQLGWYYPLIWIARKRCESEHAPSPARLE